LAHAIADRLNCVTLDCWAAQPTLVRDIGKKSIKTVVRAGRGLAKLNLITLKRIKAQPGLRHGPVFCPKTWTNLYRRTDIEGLKTRTQMTGNPS
jgi:hypothetical protein